MAGRARAIFATLRGAAGRESLRQQRSTRWRQHHVLRPVGRRRRRRLAHRNRLCRGRTERRSVASIQRDDHILAVLRRAARPTVGSRVQLTGGTHQQRPGAGMLGPLEQRLGAMGMGVGEGTRFPGASRAEAPLDCTPSRYTALAERFAASNEQRRSVTNRPRLVASWGRVAYPAAIPRTEALAAATHRPLWLTYAVGTVARPGLRRRRVATHPRSQRVSRMSPRLREN